MLKSISALHLLTVYDLQLTTYYLFTYNLYRYEQKKLFKINSSYWSRFHH